MMKPKILIIDDDAAITQQLFWMLCDEFEVMTANNLSSAVRRAIIYEPDVVILDLHLPPTLDSVETGLRVLDYVKGHLPATEVFVVSSETSPATQKDCLARGAKAVLNKPLDIERLVTLVRRSAHMRKFAVA
jgi:DNA-binding NtrC family response regulator